MKKQYNNRYNNFSITRKNWQIGNIGQEEILRLKVKLTINFKNIVRESKMIFQWRNLMVRKEKFWKKTKIFHKKNWKKNILIKEMKGLRYFRSDRILMLGFLKNILHKTF